MSVVKKSDISQKAKELSALGNSKGGKVRAQKLSPDERKAIAQKAAAARWGKKGAAKKESSRTV
jgi:hypothetical protein